MQVKIRFDPADIDHGPPWEAVVQWNLPHGAYGLVSILLNNPQRIGELLLS